MCAVDETETVTMVETVARTWAATNFLAESLAAYRCRPCRYGDSHDVCDQPDWAGIGQRMREILVDLRKDRDG